MPDKDGNAALDPKTQATLVELLNVAAKAAGLAERATIDKESGAVLFDAFEVWDDETTKTDPGQRGYVVYVGATVYSHNRDIPDDFATTEVGRFKGETLTAAEVVQRIIHDRIWNALEDHGIEAALKECEAAQKKLDEEG